MELWGKKSNINYMIEILRYSTKLGLVDKWQRSIHWFWGIKTGDLNIRANIYCFSDNHQ